MLATISAYMAPLQFFMNNLVIGLNRVVRLAGSAGYTAYANRFIFRRPTVLREPGASDLADSTS
jgi:hypothetical protein